MPTYRPRAISPMFLTSGALRAQALVILATLQVGLTAALSAPGVGVPTTPIPDVTVAFAQQPPADGLMPAADSLLTPSPVPTVRTSPAPIAKARKPVAKKSGKAARYIPYGTGMWTYLWDETEGGNAKRIVSRAKANGLTHLYVRTGTRKGGFDGGPTLKKLLPATKGTDIKIIAWDFPQLKNPEADARRLAAAARFRVKGAPRVAAVAPDIETGAEGTILSAGRVETYMRTLRRLLPDDVSIIGVTPWPSEKRLGKYPFGKVAKYSDALAPMAYWVNRDPATVARQTMARFKQYGKPIVPIGQAYDPRIDVPDLPWGPPSRADVVAFLKAARKAGAPGASLWVWQFASKGQWSAIDAAEKLFPKAPPR